MLEQLQQESARFKRSPAGHRFRNHYGRAKVTQENNGTLGHGRFMRTILAILSFIVGVVFSILPVLPGFVFFFISAGLLATDSYRAAQFMDWGEVKLREIFHRMKRRWRALLSLGRQS
jgi:hypothetical protein